MDQIELNVTKREILGKKNRFLRRQGITPVHVFGHGVESAAVQCETARLERVLAQTGRTRLISLKLDSEKRPRTVVAREVQREPRTGDLLHVDFYQVKMAEKIRVEVPVVLTGEAPALKLKDNTLEQDLDTLTVECLPARIPGSVELDLGSLTEPDQALRVKDIELDGDITIVNDPEVVVARISARPLAKIEEVAEEAGEAGEAERSPE